MLNNIIRQNKKPDIDNIVKIILDALNKIAFKDDNQITKIEVEKRYSKEERRNRKFTKANQRKRKKAIKKIGLNSPIL